MADISAPPVERLRHIDLIKGLACCMMLIGHAVRIQMPHLSIGGKIFLYIMDFSGPLFFMASGMNVVTYIERNSHKKNFLMTRFYLLSAALLFILGFSYNMNRASLGFPDIFQCVALGTAVTYLLVRFKTPSFWLLVIALIASAVFWRWRADIVPGLELYRGMNFISRGLFCHFSLLPWLSFFLVGAATHRILKKGRVWILAGLFAALFAGSFLLTPTFFDDTWQLMFRGVPYYVIQTVGGSGLFFLAARRWCKGPVETPVLSAIQKRFETLGKESFMFLIAHWCILSAIHKAYPTMNAFARAAVLLALAAWVTPHLAGIRDRISREPRFLLETFIVMAGFWVVTLLTYVELSKNIAHFVSYGASLAFAFGYPKLRERLREYFTQSPTEPGKAASSSPARA